MDPKRLKISRYDFVAAVAAEGVPVSGGYIGKMVYEYPVLVEHRAFENCHFPWTASTAAKSNMVREDPSLGLENSGPEPSNSSERIARH